MKLYTEYIRSLLTQKIRTQKKNLSPGLYIWYVVITIIAINIALDVFAWLFNETENFSEYRSELMTTPSKLYAYMGIFVFPLVEELTFRLGLNQNRSHILISSALIFSFFITLFILHIYQDEISNHFLTYLILHPIIALISFFALNYRKFEDTSLIDLLVSLVKNHFRFSCYLSAILFSLSHILFQLMYQNISVLAMTFGFITYFFSGLIFNKMRIEKGFLFAVIFHACYNALGFLPFFLTSD